MTSGSSTYENGSAFFRNTACPYFPCHRGVDEAAFNCLFCYCPLYALGPHCGGNFRYTERGVKDCTNCTMLHEGDGGAEIVKRHFASLSALARRKGDADDTGEGSSDTPDASDTGVSDADASDASGRPSGALGADDVGVSDADEGPSGTFDVSEAASEERLGASKVHPDAETGDAS